MDVQWNTELVGLSQYPEHVSATLTEADGSRREIRAKWLAGCDGPHSAVRTLSTIAYPGAPYEHVFFVADTSVTGPMVPGELNVFFWRDGFHVFFPMRGADHWRVVGIVPRDLRTHDDLEFESIIPSIRDQVAGTLSFQECRWFSTYRIHHRRAEKFRDRRCFLLGDAAHIHSPVGAQGMNTGLQDSYNLAWKLALVVLGRAGERLLDSYEIERVPIAERLLKTTDQAFSLIVSDQWLAGIFRTRLLAKILAIAMTFDKIRKLAFRTISQVGIHYRKSPLSETLAGFPDDAPQAGDRFPWLRLKLSSTTPPEDLFTKLDDTRFTLIVIGQPLIADLPELSGLLRILPIPDDPINDRELSRAGIPKPSFYVLRPDGHIGLAGIHLKAIELNRYLAERLEIRTASA